VGLFHSTVNGFDHFVEIGHHSASPVTLQPWLPATRPSGHYRDRT
jgi:hypothetical protein